jgi:hypothetical protein
MNEFSGARHGTLSRFVALAEAVRLHEQATESGAVARRPRAHSLYKRLHELEQSLPIAGGASAPLRSPLRGH